VIDSSAVPSNREEILATGVTTIRQIDFARTPWMTPNGIDLARFPIDVMLRKALSADEEEFRSACSLLRSMCAAGRTEAGIFLIGLLHQYSDNYPRLSEIAEALTSFPSAASAAALAAEVRRVKGSSATRGYLRRVIKTLEMFPAEHAQHHLVALSRDPKVGPRFRQRLRALTEADRDLNYMDFDENA